MWRSDGGVWGGCTRDRQVPDIGDEEVGATDVTDQLRICGIIIKTMCKLLCEVISWRSLTSGLKELHNCPHSDVLKCCVWTAQEAEQIFMHSTIRFVPNVVECRVVICGRPAIWYTKSLDIETLV
jgi:hypothetical protein